MEGFDGDFNTIRPSLAWMKRVKVGDVVLLIDKRDSKAFARAKVTALYMGPLAELAQHHAHMNHNQKAQPFEGAADRLMENMRRRYGPRIICEGRKATVIYLKRM